MVPPSARVTSPTLRGFGTTSSSSGGSSALCCTRENTRFPSARASMQSPWERSAPNNSHRHRSIRDPSPGTFRRSASFPTSSPSVRTVERYTDRRHGPRPHPRNSPARRCAITLSLCLIVPSSRFRCGGCRCPVRNVKGLSPWRRTSVLFKACIPVIHPNTSIANSPTPWTRRLKPIKWLGRIWPHRGILPRTT